MKDAWMQPPASLRGAWLLHASFWSRCFPAHAESSIVRLLLSLARGAHDEPTMLERCTAAACLQLESCMKTILRMMEGSAEGFSALSKGRNQIAISVALSWRRASQRTHRACGHFSSHCLALQQSAGGLCSRLPLYL